MDKWLQFAANAGQARDFSFSMILKNRKRTMGGGPKIFVGMPSATGGAGDPKFYRTPEEAAKIYEVYVQTCLSQDGLVAYVLRDCVQLRI